MSHGQYVLLFNIETNLYTCMKFSKCNSPLPKQKGKIPSLFVTIVK